MKFAILIIFSLLIGSAGAIRLDQVTPSDYDMYSHKFTNMSNGSAMYDAMTVGQGWNKLNKTDASTDSDISLIWGPSSRIYAVDSSGLFFAQDTYGADNTAFMQSISAHNKAQYNGVNRGRISFKYIPSIKLSDTIYFTDGIFLDCGNTLFDITSCNANAIQFGNATTTYTTYLKTGITNARFVTTTGYGTHTNSTAVVAYNIVNKLSITDIYSGYGHNVVAVYGPAFSAQIRDITGFCNNGTFIRLDIANGDGPNAAIIEHCQNTNDGAFKNGTGVIIGHLPYSSTVRDCYFELMSYGINVSGYDTTIENTFLSSKVVDICIIDNENNIWGDDTHIDKVTFYGSPTGGNILFVTPAMYIISNVWITNCRAKLVGAVKFISRSGSASPNMLFIDGNSAQLENAASFVSMGELYSSHITRNNIFSSESTPDCKFLVVASGSRNIISENVLYKLSTWIEAASMTNSIATDNNLISCTTTTTTNSTGWKITDNNVV